MKVSETELNKHLCPLFAQYQHVSRTVFLLHCTVYHISILPPSQTIQIDTPLSSQNRVLHDKVVQSIKPSKSNSCCRHNQPITPATPQSEGSAACNDSRSACHFKVASAGDVLRVERERALSAPLSIALLGLLNEVPASERRTLNASGPAV